jgi:hypothetical protein
MKLLKDIDYTKEDLVEMTHFEKIPTDEEIIDLYELTGEVMICKGDKWLDESEDCDEFFFYCGPSIGNGCVSDTIFIDKYLSVMAMSLDIKLYIQASENFHEILVSTKEEANEIYDRIKEYIKKDYELDEEL